MSSRAGARSPNGGADPTGQVAAELVLGPCRQRVGLADDSIVDVPILALTGTSGKTTTIKLIPQTLRCTGHAVLKVELLAEHTSSPALSPEP